MGFLVKTVGVLIGLFLLVVVAGRLYDWAEPRIERLRERWRNR